MSKKATIISIIVFILLAVIASGLIFDWGRISQVVDDPQIHADLGNVSEKIDLIQVNYPGPNMLVNSPLLITGKARGTWFFEASFPIEILDTNGQIIAQGPAQALGEWMTADFVPFSLELTFSPPLTKTGTIVFRKDNPSGLPENEDSLYFPIIFSQ